MLQPRYLQRTLSSASSSDITGVEGQPRVQAGWVALIAVLDILQQDPHHWPVGKTTFQKLAYFATAAGVPTGLDFEAGSYGPFSKDVGRMTSKLVNNDLLGQDKLGRMVAHQVGPTFSDAQKAYAGDLALWEGSIAKVADLLARLRTTRAAEVAASVHFASDASAQGARRISRERSVLNAVLRWKHAMKPALTAEEALLAMRSLAMLGWLELEPTPDLVSDEAALVGFDDRELVLF